MQKSPERAGRRKLLSNNDLRVIVGEYRYANYAFYAASVIASRANISTFFVPLNWGVD